MAEWFKAPVLKTGVGESSPGVRIPLRPLCLVAEISVFFDRNGEFVAASVQHSLTRGLHQIALRGVMERPFAPSDALARVERVTAQASDERRYWPSYSRMYGATGECQRLARSRRGTRKCDVVRSSVSRVPSPKRIMPMSDTLLNKYGLNERRRLERKAYLSITPEDETAVSGLEPYFEEIAVDLAEGFYSHLLGHPATAGFLRDSELVARLKQLQMGYFHELISGKYDEAYFETRLRVGEAHQSVGLEPVWYLGAYNQYIQIAFPMFAARL